jgi:TetR/AcrR family transcriptional repressor of nem operon
MADKRTEVLNAAEARIRSAGYSGFSFRELASDVGVKSSSIHYYFPAKEDLGVAVARRYADRFFEDLEHESGDRAQRLALAFEKAIRGDGKMCLCGALGVASASLPPPVALEATAFFKRALEFLLAGSGPVATSCKDREWAFQVLALLEGGMMLALALEDSDAYHKLVQSLPQRTTPAPRKLSPKNMS